MDGLVLEHLREDYRQGALDETTCETNPLLQFRVWMEQARAVKLKEPNAMTLATATHEGFPSARIVLLKELTDKGFVFYTNYTSRKGRECETNPNVALTFYWAELERQVRVEGEIQKVASEKSEAYFRGRPKGSRLGALASHQSDVLPSRAPLEARLNALEREYADSDDVPMPSWWGGYLVLPKAIEFWQGRQNRLHDRLLYRATTDFSWTIERLSP